MRISPVQRSALLGFTMLEALVTLTILGMLVAVVFPNMSRWYAGMQARQALGVVRGQLQQLPAVAVFTGQDLSLADVIGPQAKVSAKYRLDMPPGWVLTSPGELRFLRTGFCRVGQAKMQVTNLPAPVGITVRVLDTLCTMEVAVQIVEPAAVL